MTQVVKKEERVSISNFVKRPNINSFLESTLADRKSEFISNLIALANNDKNLQECEPKELMQCAMNATALNLPLNKNLGYAYVIPYKNNRENKTEPQFQIGWKGFVQLAIRSGQYKTINSCEVREGEIKRNKFTGHMEFLEENENGKVVGYLAYIEMLNGFQQSLYMSVEQVVKHADKYSKAFNANIFKKLKSGEIPQKDMWKYSSPWYSEFDTMAKKTVLKLLLNRYGSLSTEMQKAIEVDQQDAKGNYIDNDHSETRAVSDVEIIHQEEPTEQAEPKTVNLKDL